MCLRRRRGERSQAARAWARAQTQRSPDGGERAGGGAQAEKFSMLLTEGISGAGDAACAPPHPSSVPLTPHSTPPHHVPACPPHDRHLPQPQPSLRTAHQVAAVRAVVETKRSASPLCECARCAPACACLSSTLLPAPLSPPLSPSLFRPVPACPSLPSSLPLHPAIRPALPLPFPLPPRGHAPPSPPLHSSFLLP